MDIIVQIAELIGFDILFLGGITLIACALAHALWQHPPLDVAPFVACIENLKKLFASKNTFVYVALTLSAALLGMVINVSADRALDNECIVHRIPTFGCKPFKAEDELKRDAIEAAVPLAWNKRIFTILRNQPGPDGSGVTPAPHKDDPCSCARDDLRPAKALMQHAYAVVQRAEDSKSLPGLRYELLAVKVLRVLALLVVALCTVIFLRAVWPTTETTWRIRLASILVMVVIAMTLGELLLGLWMAQSGRYYRKLIHAYIVMAAKEDKAF